MSESAAIGPLDIKRVMAALPHRYPMLLVDRVLPRGVGLEEFIGGRYWSVLSWARRRCALSVDRRGDAVELVCRVAEGRARLEKRLAFTPAGGLTVGWTWNPEAADPGDVFTSELSLAGPLSLVPTPDAEVWRFDIETVAKSERGLDRTRQGEAVLLRWPVELGAAGLAIEPPRQPQR